MAINALDHVNIRSSRITESIAFYRDLLGMTVGPVPGQTDISESAWVMSDDGRPVVHLNAASDGVDFLGNAESWTGITGSARVHHVAFDCGGYDEMRDRLAGAGLPLQFNEVEPIGLRQIFARDPNGVLIELNFR
jgi:catechol 2,3-dioxygenase-like lactoylglutathione lyase family enzyme